MTEGPRFDSPLIAAMSSTPTLSAALAEVRVVPADALRATGTRRRRLWDLGGHAHCPVVGVCMPIAALRRLWNKVVAASAVSDDYDLHSRVVTECRTRNHLSEAVQKDLDERYQLVVRRAAKLKSTEELAAWWDESFGGGDLPGVFWAALTHPRCDGVLEFKLLGQVHMLQHQVGMATRVELGRFEALIDENAVLTRELAAVQARSTRQVAEFTRRSEEAESQLLRQRASTLLRETELARLREELDALERAAPALRARQALAQENHDLRTQIQELRRELAAARDDAQRQRARADAMQGRLEGVHEAASAQEALAAQRAEGARSLSERALAERSVLCVGGRQAIVPLYRHVIERTGGRFLHHDGGDEDSAAKLDATLAAADLVICQTGCVSHDAYWRVKDHCKRTGKRCVFVETPSRAALERALIDVVNGAAVGAGTDDA